MLVRGVGSSPGDNGGVDRSKAGSAGADGPLNRGPVAFWVLNPDGSEVKGTLFNPVRAKFLIPLLDSPLYSGAIERGSLGLVLVQSRSIVKGRHSPKSPSLTLHACAYMARSFHPVLLPREGNESSI